MGERLKNICCVKLSKRQGVAVLRVDSGNWHYSSHAEKYFPVSRQTAGNIMAQYANQTDLADELVGTAGWQRLLTLRIRSPVGEMGGYNSVRRVIEHGQMAAWHLRTMILALKYVVQ